MKKLFLALTLFLATFIAYDLSAEILDEKVEKPLFTESSQATWNKWVMEFQNDSRVTIKAFTVSPTLLEIEFYCNEMLIIGSTVYHPTHTYKYVLEKNGESLINISEYYDEQLNSTGTAISVVEVLNGNYINKSVGAFF